MKRESWIGQFARWATDWTGSTAAFLMALSVVIVWIITGPVFNYSDTWQLVINTGTTIVTFLMVFLIQRAQNKDSRAVHLKLNELVAAMQGASNRLLNVEDLSETELKLLHDHYCHLVKLAKNAGKLTDSHSVEEAEGRHEQKMVGQSAQPQSSKTKPAPRRRRRRNAR
ncbi:low affinity iron permease family protein [Anatilimnocola sp. NA78]|uniref:low affinity iron permease family protein n=1 Tax=Anatilimnocola sp. NA78 TaxID=3415683 RepID=UPI003CE58903